MSADSDPYTGYVIYFGGAWHAFGGTSAAAPLWAALLTLTDASDACQGSPVGFANPALYAAAAAEPGAFHDVTSGNNDYTETNGGTYPALPGYDMASGLGTPTANLPGALCTAQGAGALAITSASSALFALGDADTFTVTTSGSPTPAITETGPLPLGITFTDNGDGTATITGTPTQSGTLPVSLTATEGSASVSQSLTVVVGTPPTITSPGNATFAVGSLGSFQMTASGTPSPSFTVTGGSLPAGLVLTSTGDLGGTPATATSGMYDLTVEASNGVSPASTQNLIVTVDGAPRFTSATEESFVLGTSGSFTVTTSAAPTATLHESGTLPPGMTFTDNGDGTATLAGTPTAVGNFPLSITAQNEGGSTSQNLTVQVVASARCAGLHLRQHGDLHCPTTGGVPVQRHGHPGAHVRHRIGGAADRSTGGYGRDLHPHQNGSAVGNPVLGYGRQLSHRRRGE